MYNSNSRLLNDRPNRLGIAVSRRYRLMFVNGIVFARLKLLDLPSRQLAPVLAIEGDCFAPAFTFTFALIHVLTLMYSSNSRLLNSPPSRRGVAVSRQCS